MSAAETLGARLLAEAHEESLDELLSEIRQCHLPNSRPFLSLDALDRLLSTFRCPLSQVISQRPGWTSPASVHNNSDDWESDLNTLGRDAASSITSKIKSKPPVIEFTSHRSSSGKTNLLYYLTALSILPRIYRGKDGAIVWLDTDGRFSALRLFQISRHVLTRNHPELSPQDRDTIAKAALQHVHVFQPQSSGQLLSTLCSLPHYLLSTHNHKSGPRTLDLLALDSATSFHWQDRFDSEIARLEAGSETQGHTQASKASEIIKHLRRLQHQFDCCVVYTTTPISATMSSRLPPERSPDVVVSPWTAFATLTINISRSQAPQFAASMTAEEGLRDEDQEIEAASRDRHSAVLDWSRSESWASGVRDAVEKLDGKGRFEFRVVAEGVEVE